MAIALQPELNKAHNKFRLSLQNLWTHIYCWTPKLIEPNQHVQNLGIMGTVVQQSLKGYSYRDGKE